MNCKITVLQVNLRQNVEEFWNVSRDDGGGVTAAAEQNFEKMAPQSSPKFKTMSSISHKFVQDISDIFRQNVRFF